MLAFGTGIGKRNEKWIFTNVWGSYAGQCRREKSLPMVRQLFCAVIQKCQTGGLWVKKELAGDVPAYKVVNSQGVLSGAASFEHPDLQRMLLEEEGIEISMDNKVDLKKYGWKNSLEDAEFFRETFRRKGI